MTHRQTNDWLIGIRSYFRFVNKRRPDLRFSVLPDLHALYYFYILCFMTVLVLTMIFIDLYYLEWVREGHAARRGIFHQITVAGNSNWILVLTGAILLTFSFLRANRFKGARFVAWHRLFLNVYFVFTTIAFSGLIALGLKNLIGKPRPAFVEATELWELFPLQGIYAFSSFPSGHSTTAGAIIAAIWLLFPRWGWLFFPLGVWVAVSRMAIGVHFPSDVLAGFMLGIVFTWIYARSFAKKRLLFCFDDEGKLCLRGN